MQTIFFLSKEEDNTAMSSSRKLKYFSVEFVHVIHTQLGERNMDVLDFGIIFWFKRFEFSKLCKGPYFGVQVGTYCACMVQFQTKSIVMLLELHQS